MIVLLPLIIPSPYDQKPVRPPFLVLILIIIITITIYQRPLFLSVDLIQFDSIIIIITTVTSL